MARQPPNAFNAQVCLLTDESQPNHQRYGVFEVPPGYSATVKFSRSSDGVSTFNVIPPTPPGAPAVSQLRTQHQQQSPQGFAPTSFGTPSANSQQRVQQNSPVSGYYSDPTFGAQAPPNSTPSQPPFTSTQLRSPQTSYFDSLDNSRSARSLLAPHLSPILGAPPQSPLLSAQNQGPPMSRQGSSAHSLPRTPMPPPMTSQLQQRPEE